MKILTGREKREAISFLEKAVEFAGWSKCERKKCGAVIVKNGKVIGYGFNSPPGNLESQRRCSYSKADYDPKVTDKTCCVHAEQRAVMDALKKNSNFISGSRLYFISLDDEGNKNFAGKPYCTICSKMVLDSGVKEFILWHEEGITVYNTEDYNDRSFAYKNE